MLEESTKTIKLENIEDEVLNGVAGARKAISFLQSLSDNSSPDIHSNIKNMENMLKSISSRTLNFIATNESYKKQIVNWTNQKTENGTKEMSSTSQSVAGLIADVEEKLNRSILSAKRSDVKLKRQHEKKIVSNFYKTNKNELKKIFDLQNLLIRAKIGINKSK
jgi:hypothetical protein